MSGDGDVCDTPPTLHCRLFVAEFTVPCLLIRALPPPPPALRGRSWAA